VGKVPSGPIKGGAVGVVLVAEPPGNKGKRLGAGTLRRWKISLNWFTWLQRNLKLVKICV
jgi:hypothetical protein